MSIVVRKRNPITHSIKVAIATLMIFIVVGLVARITRKSEGKIGESEKHSLIILSDYLNNNSSLLIQSIRLPVPVNADERIWASSFAELIGGRMEAKIDNGRIDILTNNYAIEVEFIKKWKEGLGQAIYYGTATNRIGVLALIIKSAIDDNLLKTIEKIATEKNVKVILLKSK